MHIEAPGGDTGKSDDQAPRRQVVADRGPLVVVDLNMEGAAAMGGHVRALRELTQQPRRLWCSQLGWLLARLLGKLHPPRAFRPNHESAHLPCL